LTRPLPEPVLFLDECLGSTDVPTALREMGIRVELLHQHFEPDIDDTDWLVEVGKRGWVVLTKDQRIRHRRAEFQALLDAGVAVFVLKSGNLTGKDTANAFVRAYPRMQKVLRDHEPPFVAGLDAAGRVTLLTAAVRRAARKKES
jgi:PIN like domain